VLGQLAEAALNIALAIERQATRACAEGAGPAEEGDVALAHVRVGRAVRLTVLLQSKLIKGLQALDRGAQLRLEKARKDRIERIVERVAKATHEKQDIVERLIDEASERLDDDIYGDVMTQPISEIVARICRDLGLEPDWARLAQEAWALEEIHSGAPGWPLAASPPMSATGPARLAPRAGSP